MKAVIISENKKRMTAQIVIKYDDGDCKRSTTRHCQAAPGGWRGYLLDAHRRELEALQIASEGLARYIDAANRELGIKASKATPFEAVLLFTWKTGADNAEDYAAQLNDQRRAALQNITRLTDEADRLHVRVEAHRAAEREKRLQSAVAVTAFATLMTA